MLHGIVPRLYQETILNTCSKANTLVVLPTGLGKTAIAMLLAAHRLQQIPGSKILIVAPTKPLVLQHQRTFREHFTLPSTQGSAFPTSLFTGEVSPAKRRAAWHDATFIFATPQSLENDLLSNRISLHDVSLLVVDEAHRAVGDYAYVYLAKRYHETAQHARILALTASPGSEIDHILDVCTNLHIQDVEVRSITDAEVSPYVQKTDFTVVKVELPEELLSIKQDLDSCFSRKIEDARKLKLLGPGMPTKGALLMLQEELRTKINAGEKDFETLRTVSLLAEAFKVSHAQELLESQGLSGLLNYFKKIDAEAMRGTSKAVKNLAKDLSWRSAYLKTQRVITSGIMHPKIPACASLTKEIITKQAGNQVIIFTQFRDTAKAILDELGTIPGMAAELFVGQAKRGGTGLSQKEQEAVLEDFRNHHTNVLVATSVAEEGLDIPSVSAVIFYEPIPSAIRSIQRRGRTARHEKGLVYVLSTKGGRDDIYRWSSHRKEQRMHRLLSALKTKLAFHLHERSQTQTILSTPNLHNGLTISVDYREKGSPVMKELLSHGIQLDVKHLHAGDYQVSPRVVIEYKTSEDFVNSIIDKRIFTQARAIKSHAVRPIIIVEGERDIYSIRNIHPNAINGLLSTLAVTFNIPVIFTRNPAETAATIISIAKREDDIGPRAWSSHQIKKPATPKEQQEYFLASLPGVSGALAKSLLEHFGTPARVLTASVHELKQVPLIGDRRAEEIHHLLHEPYPAPDLGMTSDQATQEDDEHTRSY